MNSHQARPPDHPPGSVTLQIAGPLRRADLSGLHVRACALLGGDGVELLRCELAGVRADTVSLDTLARLALAARRRGARIQLHGATHELKELIDRAGLSDVLGG